MTSSPPPPKPLFPPSSPSPRSLPFPFSDVRTVSLFNPTPHQCWFWCHRDIPPRPPPSREVLTNLHHVSPTWKDTGVGPSISTLGKDLPSYYRPRRTSPTVDSQQVSVDVWVVDPLVKPSVHRYTWRQSHRTLLHWSEINHLFGLFYIFHDNTP